LTKGEETLIAKLLQEFLRPSKIRNMGRQIEFRIICRLISRFG
jgi:hypothetical protein